MCLWLCQLTIWSTFRFGGDPYLSGEGAFTTISGIQSQGVQAVAKHFINKLAHFMLCFLLTETFFEVNKNIHEHQRLPMLTIGKLTYAGSP